MNRFVRIIAVGLLPALAGVLPVGCVTAHEAHVKIDVLDNTTRRQIDDCLLLAIRMESLEKQGRWWVAQDEEGGHMIPRDVQLTTVNSGEMLDQAGKVMVTIGPYVHGHTMGVEYWLFRPGYQPDDFLSDHVERAYENKTTLNVNLLREDSGSSISDEKVLDGARRVLEIVDFLEPDSPDATRLLTLMIEQVRQVEKNSYKPKWQKQSKELLPKLQKELKRFPRVHVTWKNPPAAPVEPPEPAVAKAPAVKAPPAPTPVETTPEDTPDETTLVEVPLEPIKKQTAAANVPAAKPQPAEEEEEPGPGLIPVDLSDMETSTPETQPTEDADEDTVQNDLKPIRKKP